MAPPLALAALPLGAAGAVAAAVSPLDAAQGDIVSYVLGFGPLGVIALALGWVLYRGTFTRTSAHDAEVRQLREDHAAETARREAAHATEIAALRADRQKSDDARDAAVKMITDTMFPLVSAFNTSIGSLMPILQRLVSQPPPGGS